MQKQSQQKGFTLVEILTAISVFAIVIAMSTTVYINVTREHRRASLQNAIYEDARLILEQITNQVRQYGIDYEEYHSHLVAQASADAADKEYGVNYGKYGSKFYDPGFTLQGGSKKQGTHPTDLGSECGDGTPVEQNVGCILYIPSLDINTGKNPYNLSDLAPTDSATAFCETNCAGATFNAQDQLFLINADGTRKVIFAKEEVSKSPSEYSLSILELVGFDTDSNGVVDEYNCDTAKGFECASTPTAGDLTDVDIANPTLSGGYTSYFVPISSKDTNVKDLKFIVSPIEDPRKAFKETTSDIQMQPHVTVVLTVEATQTAVEQVNLITNPSITLQTTITPRIYNEVQSFPPCANMQHFTSPTKKNCLGQAI